uniref:ephrin-B1-like isoform X2 n=1 Tax=Myxine glutinosa TaxID=7769 RepID=UPI00358EEABD
MDRSSFAAKHHPGMDLWVNVAPMPYRFRPGGTLVLHPNLGDKMDIICPKAKSGNHVDTSESRDDAQFMAETPVPEFYRLYLVSRQQAEDCETIHENRFLLNCHQPQTDVKYTIKFQEFSPNFYGLEFIHDQDYFIISTSNGSQEGLDNQVGGVCHSHGMRIMLTVHQDPNEVYQETAQTSLPGLFLPPQPPQATSPTHTSNVNIHNSGRTGLTDSAGDPDSGLGSDIALIVGIASGCVIFLLLSLFVALFAMRRRCGARHATALHRPQRKAAGGGPIGTRSSGGPYSLTALANARRAMSLGPGAVFSGSGTHLVASSLGSGSTPGIPRAATVSGASAVLGGTEPSDILLPLRARPPSDGDLAQLGGLFPHYEKVSGDYGHPVYIVQSQSPANVYYKV